MKRYTEEFKKEAVRLALESGKSQGKIANDLGVNTNSLGAWIKKAREESGGEYTEAADQEIKRLRRELSIVTQERDILKKAVGIFSKELR